jgi:hypothetical protein
MPGPKAATGQPFIANASRPSRHFLKALQRTPNRPKLIFGLARAANALGDTETARKRYEEFLANWRTADPDRPEIAKAMEFREPHHP